MDSWVCPKCGKRFAKQQSLAGHMGHHNGVARNSYVTREELVREISETIYVIYKEFFAELWDRLERLEDAVRG